ncbi:NACHT domain-containing protein [Glycomyces mayteni]|uniref:NACHT domain-containing protein n=1 Tax=Glycomyces mayteni TaxID=543887 RepID=A0ABW2D1F9_9ACTN|nr:NACHT domain-containing protein [Glycomyces mayteni]
MAEPKPPNLRTRVSTGLLAVVAIPLVLPAAEPLFQGNLTLRILIAVALVVPGAVIGLRGLLRRRTAPRAAEDRADLHDSLVLLAGAVEEEWSAEAVRLDLAPGAHALIDVRWRTAPGRGGAWGDQTGSLSELVELYDQTDHHTLVVLGDPESGKTASMVNLTLALLAARPKDSDAPVPVLFPLADWDPDKSLEDWLVRRLADQHAWLGADEHGRDLPRRLVRGGLILPVLDALDEAPAKAPRTAVHSRAALIEAVKGSRHLPGVVVSSRRAEYWEAERHARRSDAVVIELQRLDTEQIRLYLEAALTGRERPRWDPVFAALDTGGPLADALATPLVLSLAPKVFDGTSDLADPARVTAFDGPEALKAHVLREFAPSRFALAPDEEDRRKGRVAREDAMRWLASIARGTARGGEREPVRWWRLSLLARRATRIAACAVGAGLSFASVFTGAAIGFARTGIGTPATLALAVFLGLVAAVALGTACYRNQPPAPAETQVQVDGQHLMAALKSGVPIFIFATVAGIAMVGVTRGPIVGFAFAVPIAAMYAMVAPDAEPTATNPRLLLRRDLRVGYVFGAAYGLPAFLVGLLVSGDWRLGAAFGVTAALAGATLYGLQWFFALQGGKAGAAAFVHLGLAVLALAPRGHLPWHVMRFLEEAHQRGVLRRQAGGAYVFRHESVAAAIEAWTPASVLPRPRGEREGAQALPEVE